MCTQFYPIFQSYCTSISLFLSYYVLSVEKPTIFKVSTGDMGRLDYFECCKYLDLLYA